MEELRRALLAAFDIEHREHLERIRAALAAADGGGTPDWRDVFRRAHSLKGAARAVDLPAVEEVAHRLEAVFLQVMEGRRALDAAVRRAVEAALDAIEGYVAALDSTPGAAPPDAQGPARAIAGLEALDAPAVAGVEALPASAPPPPPAEPAAGPVAADDSGPEPAPAHAGNATPAQPGNAAPGGAPSVEFLRVAAPQIDDLVASMHDMMTALQGQDRLAAEMRGLEERSRGLRRDWDGLQRLLPLGTGAGAHRRHAGLSPTEQNRFRDFDRSLRGLLRDLSGLARRTRHAVWVLEQAGRELRIDVEHVALVPVGSVFADLGRMLRDLARSEGRDVSVRTLGFDLQADRRVLQRLKDPVMHLARNAIGHGIEPAEDREAAGKPARGEIAIEFASTGGQLVVSVRDDGRGPDLARIRDTAIARGLLVPDVADVAELPAERLLSLVFEPGFSTAAAVDRISGRGMGLSVVAEAARELHGTVQLRPRRPAGAEAVLAVPFTAARQTVVVVEAQGMSFALPTHGVERLLRLPAAALELAEGRAATRLEIDGQEIVVPVVALAALAGSSDATLPVEAGQLRAALLRRGARRIAVALDALHDVRTLPVGEAQALGIDRDLTVGVALLDERQPVLVLSPEALVERWVRDEARLAASGIGLVEMRAERALAPPTVLVVDDSITTRTLQKSILEAQGYRVLLSVDGLDALTVLRRGDTPIDLVVADVEMPRMDGFSLLQAIKADGRLQRLPVILMTSRAEAQDVRRGLDLGAEAYLTKQKFDQRELLSTIGQLL